MALHFEDEEDLKNMGIWIGGGRDDKSELSMNAVGRKGLQDLQGQEQIFLPARFADGELGGSIQWSV